MSHHPHQETQLALAPPHPIDPKPKTDSNTPRYPPPLATYEQVVANVDIFMASLENLHRTLGTKFMVPTIGGKALNLHQLFMEVTSRGGLEKVIRDRKWKEIIAVFKFPTTITNASFVLRKYYISLLHHYEQLYFFRTQGCQAPVAASLPPVSPCAPQADLAVSAVNPGPSQVQLASGVSQVQSALPAERNDSTKNKPMSGSPLPAGHSVTGVIDGKFEYGYLVTVQFGSEKLKGILYHVPLELPMKQIPEANGASSSVVQRRRRRRKSRLLSRDPSHPKPNKNGYNFFFSEHYARLKPSHFGQERIITQKIGHLWSKLSPEEKAVYQEKGAKDLERYKSEMVEYRKSSAASKPS